VRRVLDQTRARVIEGDTHHPDKILSLFEPHTEVIRKGKAAKPTEFGKVVKIQEARARSSRLSRLPNARARQGAVDAGARAASRPVWPRATLGRRRRGVCIGGQRTRRARTRRHAGGLAASRAAGGARAGPAAPALASPRAAVAHRERRRGEVDGRGFGELGTIHSFVVHGSDGLDEITTTGPTEAYEIRGARVEKHVWNPGDFGVQQAALADLAGGDPAFNARIVREILGGSRGPRRDIVLVNAAAGLVAAGLATNLQDAMRIAAESIDSGAAADRLAQLERFE